MDRLLGQLFSNALGYMSYQKEREYLIQRWGCLKTTQELCLQLRTYQQNVLPFPRIEDLIRYHVRSCDQSCPYYLADHDSIPLLIYGVKQYGKILSCKSIYGITLFEITEGRYPTELELALFEHLMEVPDILVPNEPVPKRASIRLEPYSLNKTLDDRCCICQDAMTSGQRVVTLPCFHTFHTHYQTDDNECLGIESWLSKSDECPLCKQKVM